MEVTVVNRTRGRVPPHRLRRLLTRAINFFPDGHKPALAAVALVFITPVESRRLKKRFLKENRAADVLSFRYGSEGEIFFCPGVIRREARMAGKPYGRLLDELLIHGFLHLSGRHHEDSPLGARRFEVQERSLRRHLGLTP